MDLRRKNRAHIPWRIVLWSLVLTVFVLDILNDTPLHASVEFPAETPVELTRDVASDVLLVLDYDAIRASGDSFSQRDFSAAWINTFEQELGPVRIATPKTLTRKSIEESSVVVLTSSVSKSVPDALISILRENLLDDRLLVVVERPEGLLRERFSADGKVGKQMGQTFTFVRDLQDPFKQELLQMPVDIEFIGSTSAREGAQTWLSIDGAPAIYETPIGKGKVITLEFDFGELMVATQQGQPKDDFSIARPEPRTWDLIRDPRLKQNAIPFADLLERYVVHTVIGSNRVLPFYWPFPAGKDGALVAVHTDSELGNGAAWMLRHEAENKRASTLLSTSDNLIDADTAQSVDQLGGDLGLLWRLQSTPHEILDRFGLGSIKPFAKAVVLETQLENLRKKASGPVNTSMIYDNWWTTDWETPLSALASKGVRVDLSYSQDQQSGFAFGTGLPFLALDRTGLPLSIREFPVTFPHGYRAGPNEEKLLQNSKNGHHQALVHVSAPVAFADFPDIQKFNAWLELTELAESFDHAYLSVNQFDAFQRARRSGTINSARSEREQELVIELTVEAKRRDLELGIPEVVDSKVFKLARPKGSESFGSTEFETRVVNYSGKTVRLIPLNSGFTTIEVVWQ
ncbi:hypothetical protein FRD01_05030 [Microvenator marinus]|uniref:Uncharacterized protein n=1 Tax=Microvenator marinus TaxID=2600177 RepID=A0A5B8XNT9_9DELT|nr:hypothetical protein [Microvenator marinus]QED26618.1 hypothetical protein FRD01_05030 [Microvenator marinus]